MLGIEGDANIEDLKQENKMLRYEIYSLED